MLQNVYNYVGIFLLFNDLCVTCGKIIYFKFNVH